MRSMEKVRETQAPLAVDKQKAIEVVGKAKIDEWIRQAHDEMEPRRANGAPAQQILTDARGPSRAIRRRTERQVRAQQTPLRQTAHPLAAAGRQSRKQPPSSVLP